ncbi:MAG: ATP-binding protein [Desulforhopalus sp.]
MVWAIAGWLTNPMRFSLRLKLFLVSLLLLLIPLTGFRFSEMIKQDLLKSRRETMEFSARAVSSALSGRTGLLDQELFHSLNPSRDLYLYPLTSPMRINGKTDDWQPQLKEAREFNEANLLYSTEDYSSGSLTYRHLSGIRGEYLYALFQVTDDRLVYRHPNSLRVDRADHLEIGVEDHQGNLHRYFVTPKQSGWVNGFIMPNDPKKTMPVEVERRIQGMWVESPEGYILELRIPVDLVGQKLAFAIADVDDPNDRTIKYLVGNGSPQDSGELGWLLSPSGAIEDILRTLNRTRSRILIVDTNQRVRATFGNLNEPEEETQVEQSLTSSISELTFRLLSPLYQLFMQPFSTDLPPTVSQPSTLDIKGVKEALQGVSSVTSYAMDNGQVEIMAAIAPLMEEETITGAVVVEQTTNSILALQNKVIEESLTFTIIAFILSGFGLLLFATRLSSRIRRLSSQAALAISATGRVRETIPPTGARDEIGELTHTLGNMLNQLKIQIEYRERMADNLEHEMRTPLAGISASLKNMASEMGNPPEHVTRYLDWALADVVRLESMLSAIRDASNLQEALCRDVKEEFELDRAIELWVTHGWQQTFPEVDIIYHQPEEQVMLHGDPERIRQMLDKLVENAVSFHTEGSSVEIDLIKTHNGIELRVTNEGPTIAKELQPQIFNSMVSYRSQTTSTPHLGLGLYIVQTIVEHHQGKVHVMSSENEQRTIFLVTF